MTGMSERVNFIEWSCKHDVCKLVMMSGIDVQAHQERIEDSKIGHQNCEGIM